MIMNILKGLWKWIKWILVILIIFLLILALRVFVFDKDYDGSKRAQDRKERVYGSSSTDTTSSSGSSSSGGSLGQKVANGAKGIADATVSGYKNDAEHEVNPDNFDEWFLMHEGDVYDGAVENVLDHLLENSKGNFYARTSVTAVGFGDNNTVSYDGDMEAYRNGIQAMRDSVTAGNYNISFKYAGIMTYVNEIVITKI